jgi:Tol biopolymer transport system component
LTACIACVALTCGVPQASATYPGANGRIAYDVVQQNTGSSTVRTILPDGTDQQILVPGTEPSWSASGRRIAFAQDGDIFIMDADGSNVQQVTRTPGFDSSPYFAPGGRRIVYSHAGLGSTVISSIGLDGSSYKRLAAGEQPQYSPDGSQIVYNHDGTVWVMRRDGTHKRQLTGIARRIISLTFSPDGQEILYSWVTGQFNEGAGSAAMRPDASGKHPVCGLRDATFSPDGSQVAYWHNTNWGEGNDDPRFYRATNIWTVTYGESATDCHPRRITNYGAMPGRHFAENPSWQPLPDG